MFKHDYEGFLQRYDEEMRKWEESRRKDDSDYPPASEDIVDVTDYYNPDYIDEEE
jgi:hypothetical protein